MAARRLVNLGKRGLRMRRGRSCDRRYGAMGWRRAANEVVAVQMNGGTCIIQSVKLFRPKGAFQVGASVGGVTDFHTSEFHE